MGMVCRWHKRQGDETKKDGRRERRVCVNLIHTCTYVHTQRGNDMLNI